MKTVELKKIKNCDELLGKTPSKNEYSKVIKGNTVFTLDGVCIGVYVKLPKEVLNEVRSCTLETKYVETYRANGLPTKSSVFGALPRVAMRNDYCRFSSKTFDERLINKKLFNFQSLLCNIYKKFLPEQYEKDLKLTRDLIIDDYRLVDTPYTTININVNHAIKHHRDSGNIKGSYSNVLILKENCLGGELVLPEYGLALEQSDGALCIFRGQEEIHGVMPLIKTNDDFYRASIVFYTMAQLKNCYPYKEEVTRLNIKSKERAENRANNTLKK